MTSLYAISDGKQCPAVRRALGNENLIEGCVEADPSRLVLDAMNVFLGSVSPSAVTVRNVHFLSY